MQVYISSGITVLADSADESLVEAFRFILFGGAFEK
jgi:hypothetical protein